MERASDRSGGRLRLVTGGAAPLLPTLAAPGNDDVVLTPADGRDPEEVVAALVRANAASVLAIVQRYARASHDARDLAVEVFRRTLTTARRTLRKDPQRAVPFRRWLLRTALRVARKHLRDELCLAGARLDQLGRDGPPPLRLPPARDAEREARVRRAVMRLPSREREVLTLRLDPGLAFSEIATVLRITQQAAVLSFHAAAEKVGAAAGRGATTACTRWEVLLSTRAAGALDRTEAARVEAHVAGCGGCRAAADGIAEALALTAVAGSTPEAALVEDLPARVETAVRRSERRVSPRRVLVGAAVAAALLALAAALLLAVG